MNVLTKWVSRNIGGAQDFSAEVGERSNRRSPALAGAISGAAAGAAIGGVTGYLKGMDELARQEITPEYYQYEATSPRVVGASYDDVDRVYRNDRWQRQDDDWDPIIAQEPYKTYTGVRFHRSAEFPNGPFGQALVGAGKGLLLGGLLGVGAGLMVQVAGTTGIADTPAARKVARLAPAVGGVVGGMAGAVAGFQAGTVNERTGMALEMTVPRYEHRPIGWMPLESQARDIPREYRHGGSDFKIYYSELPEDKFGAVPFEGKDAVHGRTPVGDEKAVVTSYDGLDRFSGTLVGFGLGAVFGLAGGVAVSSFLRMLGTTDQAD
ncbi:MAG: hypothetical protein HY319_15630 [Armatimonadetes bacterium]|nr:hypothetical protein [Armatimonadota bacterium]